MHNKGQIASLDFILSVILVVVALGLTIQIVEANQYTIKEMEINNELERIGDTAANILISHPKFTCDVIDPDTGNPIGNMELQNCIVKSVFEGDLDDFKKELGIPDDYDFRVDLGGFAFNGNPFQGITPPATGYYSTDRIIVFWNPANQTGPEKYKLNECIEGNVGCGELKKTFITMKVWRVS